MHPLFHLKPVITRVYAVGQRADDINNGKIPLLVLPNTANGFFPKKYDFILIFFHGVKKQSFMMSYSIC